MGQWIWQGEHWSPWQRQFPWCGWDFKPSCIELRQEVKKWDRMVLKITDMIKRRQIGRALDVWS